MESEQLNNAPRRKNDKKNEDENILLMYLHDFVIAIVAIMLVFFLLFRVVVVSGPSMENTLQDGDYLLLVSKLFYTQPKVGDIIVASKESFRDGEPIIKRVIATEGQTVDIDFPNGVVYVDGVAIEEPYIKTPTNLNEGGNYPITIEEGHVFVMGDNRNDSLDSRTPDIGQVDVREILGKALFLFLPGQDDSGAREFNRIGVLK